MTYETLTDIKYHAALDEIEADLFLDWVNNYLTVEAFAHANGFSEAAALMLIERGRESHAKRLEH